MPNQNDCGSGIVYHIDAELIRKSRERQLKKGIERVDGQIKDAERDLEIFKTAEEALAKIQAILERMLELAKEAAVNPDVDKDALNARMQIYKRQIDDISESASCDGVNLINGSMGGINNIIAAINAILDKNEKNR